LRQKGGSTTEGSKREKEKRVTRNPILPNHPKGDRGEKGDQRQFKEPKKGNVKKELINWCISKMLVTEERGILLNR